MSVRCSTSLMVKMKGPDSCCWWWLLVCCVFSLYQWGHQPVSGGKRRAVQHHLYQLRPRHESGRPIHAMIGQPAFLFLFWPGANWCTALWFFIGSLGSLSFCEIKYICILYITWMQVHDLIGVNGGLCPSFISIFNRGSWFNSWGQFGPAELPECSASGAIVGI